MKMEGEGGKNNRISRSVLLIRRSFVRLLPLLLLLLLLFYGLKFDLTNGHVAAGGRIEDDDDDEEKGGRGRGEGLYRELYASLVNCVAKRKCVGLLQNFWQQQTLMASRLNYVPPVHLWPWPAVVIRQDKRAFDLTVDEDTQTHTHTGSLEATFDSLFLRLAFASE